MEIEISYLKKENEGLKQSVVFYKQKLSGAQFKLHKQSQWLRDLNLIKDELVSLFFMVSRSWEIMSRDMTLGVFDCKWTSPEDDELCWVDP